MTKRKPIKIATIWILMFLLVFSMCACGDGTGSPGDKNRDEETVAKNDAPTGNKPIDPNDGRTYLDAFKGIEFVVSGISPYCQIAVNNRNCSADVQKYVEYRFDKKHYANGETAVVTAYLNWNADSETIALSTETSSFTVSGQPEYITSLNGVDLSGLLAEMGDYVAAGEAASYDYARLFGSQIIMITRGTDTGTLGIVKSITHSEEATYFSSLKQTKLDSMDKETPYNKYTVIYRFKVNETYKGENLSGYSYTAISAHNIEKYPDGTIKWGTTGPDKFDFVYASSLTGLEHCITTNIMNGSADYNITEI